MPELETRNVEKIPRLRRWIDRSSWWTLGIVAIGWTIVFTSAFAYLTVQNRGNGIRVEEYPEYRSITGGVGIGKPTKKVVNAEPNPVPWKTALSDALYFSIATETTVGYGDLVPQGGSRFLACIEAIGGLMCAGVFVTKITTGPSGKTKYIIKTIEGQWIEFSLVKEKCKTKECVIISLITIRYDGGLLRYDGHNYDWDGHYRRGFQGSSQPLSTIDGQTIWFDYNNLRGDKEVFKEGRTVLRFRSLDPNTHVYTYFEGKAEDSAHENDIPMFGHRATGEEACPIEFWKNDDADREARSKIARDAYQRHVDEIMLFAAKRGLSIHLDSDDALACAVASVISPVGQA